MATRTSLLATFGLLAFACNEYDLVGEGESQDGLGTSGTPDIKVNPGLIAFGDIEVSLEDPNEITETVKVRNKGDADLHITDIYLDDDGAPYTIGTISSVLIQPDQVAVFTVTYLPETAELNENFVLVESDDPDEPTAEVELIGSGIAPVIEVAPTEYDFGTLYVGCDLGLPVTVSNVGNADLVVTGFEFNTASIDDLVFEQATTSNGELPWTLAPGQSTEVYVNYAPYDEYNDIAYLFVSSSDPFTPEVMATQRGNGALFGTNLDEFEQPLKGATDIIFAVDRSCSMDDNIVNVQDNFGTFVSTLAGLDSDYQVAATVEDGGCINGGELFIDNSFSASDAEATITAMINLGGSYGSNTERAFMLLDACLSEAWGGCNDGLVRDDATLNLIGVSDEPEQSTNNYAYYVSLFKGLKDNPDDVIMHAIGGDYPTGCVSASAYTGFYEATVATGGLFLSICATDWGAHLEELAEGTAADLSTFELTEEPVPETIEVRVDGLAVREGWEYVASSNTVDFDRNHVPEGGSTIEIEYALMGDCEG